MKQNIFSALLGLFMVALSYALEPIDMPHPIILLGIGYCIGYIQAVVIERDFRRKITEEINMTLKHNRAANR